MIYVLWRPPAQPPAVFRDRLVKEVAPALQEHGARHVAVNVADEYVEAAGAPRITQQEPPLDGFLSFWLDEAAARAPFEASITAASARAWPFLVVESVPLRNTTHRAANSERTPGINMIACITPKADLDYEAFIAHWHTTHKTIALECQCTYAYVRNEIVRSFAPDAPPWAAIVEEGFPTAAVTDPLQWYNANGDPAVYQRNFNRVMESCLAFLALDRIESHPMSEWVFA